MLRGPDEVRRFWELMADPFDRVVLEPECFIEEGDAVVVPVRFRAEGRGGVRVDLRVVHVHWFRDGRPVRLVAFDSLDEAMRAARATG